MPVAGQAAGQAADQSHAAGYGAVNSYDASNNEGWGSMSGAYQAGAQASTGPNAYQAGVPTAAGMPVSGNNTQTTAAWGSAGGVQGGPTQGAQSYYGKW